MKTIYIECEEINTQKDWSKVEEDSIFFNLKEFVKSICQKTNSKEISTDNAEGSSSQNGKCEEISAPFDANLCESNDIIIFAFARMKNLRDKDCLNKLIEKFRDFKDLKKEQKYAPCLIVTIALEELNDVLESNLKIAKIKEDEDKITRLNIQQEIVKSLNLDKRVDFLDSSIWHYFIALNNDFEKNLEDVIKKINKNYELKLYQTNVAKEFIEFQKRIFINSYLANVGEHASAVTPFKFHSEQGMSIKTSELRKKLNGVKWRILLVDDYAEKPLKANDDIIGKTKEKILEVILNSQDNNSHTKDSIIYELETSPSVDDFKKKLQNNKEPKSSKIYDIILLDYLLGDKEGGKNNEREYSTEILKWIKGNNGELDKDLQGPLGKFWFFSMSAFPYAFIEKIRQMGYSLNDEDWTIFRGADPINMPELFKYNLFELMNYQLNEVKINSLLDKLLEFEWIGSEYFRKVEYYKEFLFSWSNFWKLVRDKSNGSLFAKSYFENFGIPDDEDPFEHLQALINFLVFEPPLKWSKIWEEYIVVKNKFPKSEKLNNIKRYILSLRSKVNV